MPAAARAGVLRRRFGYPGRLDPWERVWLRIPGITGSCAVFLNGEQVAQGSEECDIEVEVRDQLEPRNCLELHFEPPAESDGIQGEPHLLIRGSAWLREVTAVWDHGWIHVYGSLAGNNDALLDVYVIAEETIGYAALAPGEGERRFEVVTDVKLDPMPESVIVELVNGGVRWDRWTVPVTMRK